MNNHSYELEAGNNICSKKIVCRRGCKNSITNRKMTPVLHTKEHGKICTNITEYSPLYSCGDHITNFCCILYSNCV
jgi:hypothetical protein